MKSTDELMNNAKLNKQILRASWWMVLFILIITILGLLFSYKFYGSVSSDAVAKYIVIPMSQIGLILAFTQLLFKLFEKWGDYIIILGVFCLLHVYILGASADGIYYVLFFAILVSSLYFDSYKVYLTSLLCLISITGIYLFYEPVSSMMTIREYLASIGVFVCSAAISVGVINRGKNLLKNLEISMKSREELLLEKMLVDQASKLDPLTGLNNHKTFHENLDEMVEQSEIDPYPLHLAIIDIDNFKKVNDNYGHWVGDIILKRVSDQIKANVTPYEFVSRYGGEEFAIIFINKDATSTFQILEELRLKVSSMIHQELDHQAVTISIGVCTYQQGLGKENFFKRADERLYQAKRSGKNRMVWDG